MDYLAGRRPPERHWASGTTVRRLHSLYGCNMVFRDVVVRQPAPASIMPQGLEQQFTVEELRNLLNNSALIEKSFYQELC